jgi:hypothetical protein
MSCAITQAEKPAINAVLDRTPSKFMENTPRQKARSLEEKSP